MYGYIYKTTNLINNKIYIGQHIAEFFEPNKYIGSGILLTAAIDKYGRENFNCELLECCETQEKLNEREIYFIALYNSTDKTIGYNIATGGKAVDISDEYFEIIRPKLQHPGLENGNVRYTIDQCNKVKHLLDEGLCINTIAELSDVAECVVGAIRRGVHWSCAEDGYKCSVVPKKNYKQKAKLTKAQRAASRKLHNEQCRQQAEAEFLQSAHFCLQCGAPITKLIGKGLFCSKKCGCKYGAEHRDNTNIILAIKQRDYTGEKNPNYGKKASQELRQKISDGIKNSDKYINVLNSPRFSGHTHTEESKQKIKETLADTLQNNQGDCSTDE